MHKLGKPIKQQVQIDMSDRPPLPCLCGCELWEQAWYIRELSAIDPRNPTRKNQYPVFPVYVCQDCGKPFKQPKGDGGNHDK